MSSAGANETSVANDNNNSNNNNNDGNVNKSFLNDQMETEDEANRVDELTR